MNPICHSCGRDVLIEPEVSDDRGAVCGYCRGDLFEDTEIAHRQEYLKAIKGPTDTFIVGM
jgi:hypothetical protein